MPKLTYISAQCRVRCEITRAETMKGSEPPTDLISRAEAKLKSEVQKGNLAFYFLYTDRLYESWNLLRQSWESPQTRQAITLGAGSPPFPGIQVTDNFFKNGGFKLTISTPIVLLSKLRFYFLYLTIQNMRKKDGIEKNFSPSLIHGIFLKASSGYSVENFPIPYLSGGQSKKAEIPYSIYRDPKSRDIFLSIHSLCGLSIPVWLQLVKDYKSLVKESQKKFKVSYKVLFPYIRHRIQSGYRGPERMGQDLPMHLLAASYIDPKCQVIDAEEQWTAWKEEAGGLNLAGEILSGTAVSGDISESKSGLLNSVLGGLFTSKSAEDEWESESAEIAKPKGVFARKDLKIASSASASGSLAASSDDAADDDIEIEMNNTEDSQPRADPVPLKIEFSEGDMSAKITNFSTDLYDKNLDFSEPAILSVFEEQGLVFGIEKEHLNDLKQKIEDKQDLNNLVVAEGKTAIQAANPFLKHSYLKEKSENEIEDQQVDVRETQEKQYVNKGGLIATIGFNDPEASGMTVKGRELKPGPPSEIERFKAGEGTELRGLEFFAMLDGIPDISGDVVSLSKTFKHKGDISLSSGNLSYEGDVLIQGSVDVGSKVYVDGNLTIEGEILEAEVVVRGNLKVKGGILGNEKAKIIVHGDLNLNFAEHCLLRVGGDCHIERSVISCKLYSRGDIKSAGSESALYGGIIRCSKNIDICFLGKEKGEYTDIAAGVDWFSEQQNERRKRRIRKLSNGIRDVQSEIKKISSTKLKNEELQQAALKKKTSLSQKLEKMQKLVPKLKEHLEKAVQPKHDKGSEIHVDTELCPNLKLRIAELSFPVPGKFAKVVIHYKVKGGTHFSSPEEVGAA